MHAFIAFFTDQLPTLDTTYRWPKNIPTNKPDAPWQFATNEATECIAMKQHLTRTWADADAANRHRLGHWIVKNWGGVRANASERIDSYIASIVASDIPTGLSGVASYHLEMTPFGIESWHPFGVT